MPRKLIPYLLMFSVVLVALSPIMYQTLINLYASLGVSLSDAINCTAGFACFLLILCPAIAAGWLGIR